VSARPARRATPGRWLAIAATVVVVVTVASALIAIGPPAQQRRLAMDARRAQDLLMIASAIDIRVGRGEKLPAALADLDGAAQWLSIKDPESAAPYGYAVTGDRTYRLCAVFATATRAGDPGEGGGRGEWSHPAGRYCFGRNTRKD
jgi:hypothetical protein